MEQIQTTKTFLASLPPAPHDTGLAADVVQQQDAGRVPLLVVLDDDPTGTQTCHGINVLTVWDHDILVEEFKATRQGFFILTNSRALPPAGARDLIRTICEAVKRAAAATEKDFEVVLRGDSTLRGHFPDEPEVAEEVLGQVDGWVLAPFFQQGGRLTINDVHYVTDQDQMVPAAQTPFAKDASFGYSKSNLRHYIVEKSKGRIPEERMISISIDNIRLGGPNTICEKLMSSTTKSTIIIVNAVVDEDMQVFVQGVLLANAQGKRYLYRTGASFVSTRLGINQISPLTLEDLNVDLSPTTPGGLIIAGSYVPKTTAQLESLIEGRGAKLNTITFQVEDLLGRRDETQATVLGAVEKASSLITQGKDVLLMTSRKLVVAEDEESSLKIGSVVATALVDFLRLLETRPRYIIAKGGITSSDAATKGLRMKRAEIIGQAASGVPLWECHEKTSKFPGIPYVVFPGNVGQNETLRELVASWSNPYA